MYHEIKSLNPIDFEASYIRHQRYLCLQNFINLHNFILSLTTSKVTHPLFSVISGIFLETLGRVMV